MKNELQLEAPWLIAVWPGMGGIAQIAARYLIKELGAKEIASLPAKRYFDLKAVNVTAGLLEPQELPKSVFFGWKNPNDGPDLVIFLGDEQPESRGLCFCDELVEAAEDLGVSRVITFAAMATPVAPDDAPRVFAAASTTALIGELREQDIHLLEDGRISGLNGVCLASASTHGLDGVCLLGEFPYFASTIANPKASAAILRAFSSWTGISIDFTDLDMQAEEVEKALMLHLERLQKSASALLKSVESIQPSDAVEPSETGGEVEDELDREARDHIETLFEESRLDRSRAVALKAELDRLGRFKEYEDRFLDLFKQAG